MAERERVRRINMKKKPRRKIALKSIRSFNHPTAAGETNKTNPLPHIYLSIYIYILKQNEAAVRISLFHIYRKNRISEIKGRGSGE